MNRTILRHHNEQDTFKSQRLLNAFIVSSVIRNRFFSNSPIVILFAIVLFSSCKQQQKIVVTKPKCNTEFRTAKNLSIQLKEKEFKFNTLDGKLNVDAAIDSNLNSFTVSLRIKKDSAIWMSISKVGIEAARVLATQDSVYFLNRINKQYFKGNYIYLSKLFSTQLDYEILQSLLVGNSVTFYDDDERLKASITNCQYMLGTIRKRKLKKVVVKGKELREPAQTIYLNPETFKIMRILFYDFDLNRSFTADFSEFVNTDSTQLFPTKFAYNIKAQKNISIGIQYTKQKFNENVSFSFKIPDNYEQIEYKEK
jgi:hypothetical protein